MNMQRIVEVQTMPSTLVLIADGTEEVELCVHFLLILQAIINSPSTITYDVLVRAGIKTTSAYVPEAKEGMTTTISPPAAKGSRGINIMPDIYLDIERCGTVISLRCFLLRVFS